MWSLDSSSRNPRQENIALCLLQKLVLLPELDYAGSESKMHDDKDKAQISNRVHNQQFHEPYSSGT